MKILSTSFIRCILYLLINIGICSSINSDKKQVVSKFPLNSNKSINPYSSNINRLNLVFDANISDISKGKSVLLVNDNKLSRSIQHHLNIAGVSNRIHKPVPISRVIEFVLDSIDFCKRDYISSDVNVVIGCNFNIFQFFSWRLKCLLNELALITAGSHRSRCFVANYSASKRLLPAHGWASLILRLFSRADGPVLPRELTAGIASCEAIKSMVDTVRHGAEKWTGKIESPQVMPIDILLIGAGAVGTEMIRILKEIGFLGSNSRIVIVDFDTVDTVNLNTQLIYREEDVGKTKVDAIQRYLVRPGNEQRNGIVGRGLEISVIYEKFDGSAGEKIFKDWFDSSEDGRVKLIIGAVDNFKTRMLIDRYSLLYSIPFLEVGIEGTKASSSITVPYLTESYSSMPGSDLLSTASCTVKGIPNNTTDTALFAKIVTSSLLFKGNNFNQTKSQIKKIVTSIFPKNNESWFKEQIDNIVNLSLKVQDCYRADGDLIDLKDNVLFRRLMVDLANLRAKAFGIPPAAPEKILSIIDDIVPSASFTTSSIVSLALTSLNRLWPSKPTASSSKRKEYQHGEYKLVRCGDVLTLEFDGKDMLNLHAKRYRRLFRTRKKIFWFFINLANNHLTRMIAPEAEVWRPDRKCLFGKSGIGLTIWDSFAISNPEMTLSELAGCYEALFNVNIIGFINLANNLDDSVLEVNDTRIRDIPNSLGLRPIAKLNNELVQLPDVAT